MTLTEMKLAERIKRLGTETAFAVSGEAAAHAAQGHRVFPFHLGDLNLPTPSTVVEGSKKAIQDGKIGYCPNAGVPVLRETLAEEINRSHGTRYAVENVAVQPGGKPVIGKFILSLMNPGDEVLYPNPGFPIYESQIEFHGGKAVPYSYREGKDKFVIDLEGLRNAVTEKTRLLIFNDLQNPMGVEASAEELEAVAKLAVERDLYVLVDEAYFDIRYSGKTTSLLSYPGMEERCVILYTFSKKFAMTGWRLGAALGPKNVIDSIIRLNVNDESCSNHFIQYGAVAGLTEDQSEPQAILATLKERRDRCVELLNAMPGVRCYTPETTFYLFPNVTEAMRNKGFDDYEGFRRDVLKETGVAFCSRIHFGRPLPGESEKYLRFAYSGIDLENIEEGLARLKAYLER